MLFWVVLLRVVIVIPLDVCFAIMYIVLLDHINVLVVHVLVLILGFVISFVPRTSVALGVMPMSFET